MSLSLSSAFIFCFAMAASIFLCRILPFLIFRKPGNTAIDQKKSVQREMFLAFVEKVVPPVAMTVLAVNAIAGSLHDTSGTRLPILIAVVFTAVLHVWKWNALISIFGGTILYMILGRLF